LLNQSLCVIYEYRDRFSDRLTTASARHNGIQIRAVGQQAIDTTSPAGRMMLQMLGSFAEFERAMLRERTKVGLESARRQGRIGGRRPRAK
jgi:DNA invertase Pin-like site-specific DNA recombinase